MARINTGSGAGGSSSESSENQTSEEDPIFEEEESTSSSSSSSSGSQSTSSSGQNSGSNLRSGRDGTNQSRESVTGTTSPTGIDIGNQDAESTGESTTVDRTTENNTSKEQTTSPAKQRAVKQSRDVPDQTPDKDTGDALSDVVSDVEGATGVDVPGEGSVIKQGQETVDDTADSVSNAGQNVVDTLSGPTRPRQRFSSRQNSLVGASRRNNPASVDSQGSVAQGAAEKSVEGGSRFGGNAEPENVIESRVPEDGDILAGTSPGVRDFGRTVLGEEAPDKEVTDSLTEGDGSVPFTLSDEERQQAEQGAQNYRNFFGVGEEAQQFTQDLTGSETAASFAGGLGKAAGDLGSLPRTIPLAVDTGIRGASNLPRTVQEEGAGDTAEAIANTATSGARGGVESFSENPVEGTGRIAGGFAAGAAVSRGAGLTRTNIRSARVRSRADGEVDLEEITSERGVQGENPTFDTDPNAPTDQAVDELNTRAADNPDPSIPGSSDSAIFHTTDADISGSRGVRNRLSNAKDKATPGETPDVDVQEGGSELPGLFASPDASPLGLDMGGGSTFGFSSFTRPRLPGRRSDQVVSLPGDDIRGMPDGAQGAGYEIRNPDGSVKERGLGRGQAKSKAEGTDLEVRPDSSTAGYDFLTNQAQEGAFYARPTGSRTPELEAISPPGSKFVEEGTTAVNMPGRSISLPGGREFEIPGTGRTIPMRRFRNVNDNDSETTGSATGDTDAPDAEAQPTNVYNLPSSRSRGVTPGQEAAGGGYLGSSVTTASGFDSGGQTTPFNDSSEGAGTGATSNPTTSPAGSSEPTSVTDLFGSSSAPTGSSSGSGSGSGGSSSGGGSSGSGSFGDGSSTFGSGSATGTPTGGSGGSSSGFYTPGTPNTPSPPVDLPDSDDDEDRFTVGQVSSEGQQFTNPVASGAEFLGFGNGLGGGQSRDVNEQQTSSGADKQSGRDNVDMGPFSGFL